MLPIFVKSPFIFGDPCESSSGSLREANIFQVPDLKGRVEALEMTISLRVCSSQSATAFFKHGALLNKKDITKLCGVLY